MYVIKAKFASPKLKMADHLTDMKAAVRHASIYLWASNSASLEEPLYIEDEDAVYIPIFFYHCSDVGPTTFDASRRLRNVAMYLFKNCEFPYEDYVNGNHLLSYSGVEEVKHFEHSGD